MLRLMILFSFSTLMFSCKSHVADKYMNEFALGENQEEWTRKHEKLNEDRQQGFLKIYSYGYNINEPVMVKAKVGSDSSFAWLYFNDDTIQSGTLRRYRIEFTEEVTDYVFKYLCSLYGKPVSDSFELGNPLITGQSSPNKELTFKDTAFHIWTWKTPSMIIQHRYNIFPPDSGQPNSYIEYRLLNDSVVRENDRQQIAHNLNVYDAINVSLMLKLPWDINPGEIKNWNYDSTVEVLCTSITNNDVATSRSVVKIIGNARFYVPMENAEIEFKDIVIIVNEPVAYKRKVSFDPPLITFKADNLNTLREHYQYVIKRVQELGKKIEYTFRVTQVQYSDGTILKDSH